MSLAETITLDKADGTDVVYKRTRSISDGSQYIDSATTLAQPGQLTFRHSVTGKGSEAVDRHLIQFSKTVLNSVGVARVLTCNFTLSVPRDSAITAVMCHDVVSNLIDFLDDAALTGLPAVVNLTALLRGES